MLFHTKIRSPLSLEILDDLAMLVTSDVSAQACCWVVAACFPSVCCSVPHSTCPQPPSSHSAASLISVPCPTPVGLMLLSWSFPLCFQNLFFPSIFVSWIPDWCCAIFSSHLFPRGEFSCFSHLRYCSWDAVGSFYTSWLSTCSNLISTKYVVHWHRLD